MTDKPLEGNPEDAGGTSANTLPSASDAQPLGGDLPKLIADLQKKINAQDGEIRALKSGKDSAVTRVEKSNEEMLEKLGRYLNVDKSQIQQAQRESVLDDLIAERIGGRQPESTISGKVEGTGSTVELGFIDTALELPANESRVTDLKLKYGNNPTEYLKQAAALKATFNQTPPSPAEQLLPPGSAPNRNTVEHVKAEYQKEMQANAQMRGDAKLRAIAATKAKYREMGLSVY